MYEETHFRLVETRNRSRKDKEKPQKCKKEPTIIHVCEVQLP